MSMTLLYNLIAASSASSGTAATGFPASNVLTTQVLRPWKGTTTGADWVQIDLGASVAVNAIAVNGGNMGSVTVPADDESRRSHAFSGRAGPLQGQPRHWRERALHPIQHRRGNA